MPAKPVLDTLFIADALDLSGDFSQTTFSGVSIDTRTIARGQLFVAIKGDRFDGHDYISKAIENGATGVLCEDSYGGAREGAVFFPVTKSVLRCRLTT